MSAIVSGHGGIGEEDRALSCLPVHVLCFQNCSYFVVVIRTLSCMVSECTTSPDLFFSLPECQCFYLLSCHGLVATLSSIPGHILALGQDASGRLPDLVSTLGSVSGFIMALGQGAPGCIPTGLTSMVTN